VLDVFPCSRRQPEDSTPGAETCRSFLFVMNYILLSVFVAKYIDCENVHCENDTKLECQFKANILWCVHLHTLPDKKKYF